MRVQSALRVGSFLVAIAVFVGVSAARALDVPSSPPLIVGPGVQPAEPSLDPDGDSNGTSIEVRR
jgi:hypothetical protein